MLIKEKNTAGLGRREFVAFLSMVMALAAVGIDMMLPAFEEMRRSFGLAADSNELARTVTAYLLGMAIGPLLYGSLADRFGRRPALWLGGTVYVIGAVASALAPTLGLLLAARFLWGLGAAGGRVVALAVIRDTQEGEQMARTMSYVMAVFILVPVIAPALGTVVVALGPWRWVFWLGALAGAAVLIWSIRLKETLLEAHRQPMRWSTIGHTTKRLVSNPAVLAPLLAMVCIRAVMATYLASSQIIIADVFNRNGQFAWIFGGVALVLGAASLLNGRLLATRSIHQLMQPIALWHLGAGVALVVVAVLAGGRPEFWVFMPLLALGLGGQMLLSPNLNTLTLQPVGDVAGTASALVATITTAGGALLGALVDARFDGTVTPLAVSVALSGLVIVGLVRWAARVAARSPVPAMARDTEHQQ